MSPGVKSIDDDSKTNLGGHMASQHLNLLLKHAALPRTKQHLSIFDIAGYPHYENVCSNILAFYLDPQEGHGLKDLLLTSLLKAAGSSTERSILEAAVHREYVTQRGGRIDLVILSENHVVGIENKIFHQLQNNLVDYRNTIDMQAGNGRTSTGIVLSLKKAMKPLDTQKILEANFLNITYPQLWHEVRAGLGLRAGNADPKWLAYLLDFMKTTELLSEGNIKMTAEDDFFIQHDDAVRNLLKDHAKFASKLNGQLDQLKNLLNESLGGGVKNFWVYKPSDEPFYVLVYDFNMIGHKIALDLKVAPDLKQGWELLLFDRNDDENIQILQKFSNSLPALRPTIDNKFIVHQWKLDELDIDTVKQVIFDWIQRISGDGSPIAVVS